MKRIVRRVHPLIIKRLPARPRAWLKDAQSTTQRHVRRLMALGVPHATNPAYVTWLKKESMLSTARELSEKYSGTGVMWQRPFAKPQPRRAAQQASVWFTAYPASMITPEEQSTLAFLARDDLWQAFEEIGIHGMHTGPMKRAGGVYGWRYTSTIDGHFDRIGTDIDELFGTEDEFKQVAATAARHNGIVIDDIIPGHTGKGADFRLAEMAHEDYPGIYHMVAIAKKDWDILPDVPEGRDAVNVDQACEAALKQRGYIVGKLYRVIFHEPGVKDTNWSVTRAVRGTDGVRRRWVYLHYFKMGQPSLNWLDPSFAGMRLVVGDALHSLNELGSRGLRLDANGFLGIEVNDQTDDAPAWSEGHPISRAANQIIASMVRKLGGFTFQELNLSMDDIKSSAEFGADLSYDFVNRPAYHHALATANADFLRITTRSALSIGIDPASLVHALQNHDELTAELVHFWTAHANDRYAYNGHDVSGMELRERVRRELTAAITRYAYNQPFTDNGIACTTVSAITAILGYESIASLSSEQKHAIQRAHLLLVMFNAWQPGVFALSGWDLVGALTLPVEQVKDLLADGDTRWINRGAYDLMGDRPQAESSSSGIARAMTFYGSLPEQMQDASSFAAQLKTIISLRESLELATSIQRDIADVSDPALFAMVHELTDGRISVTVLNFSQHEIRGQITSAYLPVGMVFRDANHQSSPTIMVSSHGSLDIRLEGCNGMILVIN